MERNAYTVPGVLTLVVLVLLLVFGIWLVINGNPLAEPENTPLTPSVIEATISPEST